MNRSCVFLTLPAPIGDLLDEYTRKITKQTFCLFLREAVVHVNENVCMSGDLTLSRIVVVKEPHQRMALVDGVLVLRWHFHALVEFISSRQSPTINVTFFLLLSFSILMFLKFLVL